MKAVEPNPHEFHANLLYAADGLNPWFACDRRVKDGDGSQYARFQHDGEAWTVKLYYQDSGIMHPGDELPSGTPLEIETIREYRLSIRRAADEDEHGQQSLNAHLAPRWPEMTVRTSDGEVQPLEYPADELGEAINVSVRGSNIAFDRYTALLQEAAAAVGLSRRYFRDPHRLSNVQDASLEVRVHRDRSGPIHARDGPIASMGHLLESDREGYRKVVQNDDDERGENLPGYYHTVTLDPRRVREAFPTHELPVEVKHYYAKEAANLPDDHPLRHPKVGVAYQRSRWSDTQYWRDLEQLEAELKRVLYSVMADAGLDVAPEHGAGPYVEDSYFGAAVREQPVDPVGLNLTELKQSQESIVIRQVADGLSPVEWESLQTLVADGGTVAPKNIAAEHDRHEDSVRRALRRLEGMVERRYGEVSLASDHIAGLVVEAVEAAREDAEAAVRRAVETSAKALEAAERGMGEGMASFLAWAARHDVDVDNARDARLCLRFGDWPGWAQAKRSLRMGLQVWRDAGLNEADYRQARVEFGGGDSGTVWHLLDR